MKKYVVIYGVQCSDFKILSRDKYGAHIQYKVKYGRKIQRCWIDYKMLFNSPILSDAIREFASKESK